MDHIVDSFPASLRGLAAEALKYSTYEEFEKAFCHDSKHGTYWHITDNPHFTIDPTKGPTDKSSMGLGTPQKGSLMVTSDLPHWHAYYNYNPRSGKKEIRRPYAAMIDLSGIPPNQYRQIRRGFGNEFMIPNASLAKVIAVYPIDKAIQIARYRQNRLPQNEESLRKIYEKAHEKVSFSRRNPDTMSGLLSGYVNWLQKIATEPWESPRSEFIKSHQKGPLNREDYAAAWVPIKHPRGKINSIEFVPYPRSQGAGVFRWNDEGGIGRGILAINDNQEITDLAVQKPWRGRGIGQQLLEEARRHGYTNFTGEATNLGLAAIHRNSVLNAVKNKSPVSPQVLLDYPDLQVTASLRDSSLQILMALRPQMAQKAQAIYDAWEQNEEGLDEELGGGGICDQIAQELADVIISNTSFDIRDGGAEGDDHAWLIVRTPEGLYSIDIHPSVYETGSGYSWKKIPDVQFSPEDVEIFKLDYDLEWED